MKEIMEKKICSKLWVVQPLYDLFLQRLLWWELHKKNSHSSTKWDQIGPTTLLLLPMLCCSSLCFAALPYFIIPLALLLLFVFCCSSPCFNVLLASPLLSVFRYSSSYFVNPPCFTTPPNSLLFLLLCCSSMLRCSSCFAALPLASLGCCSSCLVVALCFTLLLFIVLCCCSYFGVTMCFTATCVSLLFMFRYSYYFVVTWCVVAPLHFVVFLPSQVPFYPLLLCCSFVFCYSLT